MAIVETYWANIYVGRRRGYSDLESDIIDMDRIRTLVSKFCQDGPGVTITKTEFYYKDGSEPGVILGLINYPRHPSSVKDIEKDALALASIMRDVLGQYRVTVVFPDKTIMLGSIEGGRDNV